MSNRNCVRICLLMLAALMMAGCTGLPDDVYPVEPFDIGRYLGKWYEIARLDHSFERGLNQVTAEYTLREDGGVRMVNRGYSVAENRWKEAEGRAYFVRSENQGYLKVSFFGPFYGSYVIFELDRSDYRYAFVSGYNKNYLWLLARTKTVDNALVEHFKRRAKALGFDTDNLIRVRHE